MYVTNIRSPSSVPLDSHSTTTTFQASPSAPRPHATHTANPFESDICASWRFNPFSGLSRSRRAIDSSSPPANLIGANDAKDATGTKGASAAFSSSPKEAGTLGLPVYYSEIIYGSSRPQPPNAGLTLEQRKQRVDAYVGRFKSILGHMENADPQRGEAQANVNFISNRPFLRPEGYFSAGLLAAGMDPHAKITITYTTTTKSPSGEENTSGSYDRAYQAWEIAAGMHKHDSPNNDGHILNFKYEEFESKEARQKTNDLESIGETLQASWEQDIRAPISNAAGALAQRSGKADAFVVKTMLESLRRDEEAFGKLSPETRRAVNRTLDANGPVIIPNFYGYPLEGYAFIAEETNETSRPNRGLMLDIRNITVNEIKGDDAAADWAKRNMGTVLGRFNAKDAQGGTDAHWVKPSIVLDNFINNPSARLEGPVFHGSFPVREAFNYTGSATSGYELKSAPLDRISAEYATLNANNISALDQTQVFGFAQQNWKKAEEIWGNTFGYAPFLGAEGNIVFGIHDANTGMTAEERRGGGGQALVAFLQLIHETALGATHPYAELSLSGSEASLAPKWEWRVDPETNEFRLMPQSEEAATSKAAAEDAVSKPGAMNEAKKPSNTEPPSRPEISPTSDKHFVRGGTILGDEALVPYRSPSSLEELKKVGKVDAHGFYDVADGKGVPGGMYVPINGNAYRFQTDAEGRIRLVENGKKTFDSRSPYIEKNPDGSFSASRPMLKGGGPKLSKKFEFSEKTTPQEAQRFVDSSQTISYAGAEKGFVYRGFVFRGDMRSPDVIFREGFKLREPIVDINQVNGFRGGFGGGHDALDPDGKGISTSAFYQRDGAGAYYYGGNKGGYTYVIDGTKLEGYHLYANRHLQEHPGDTRIKYQPLEINYGTDIPGVSVVGAFDKEGRFTPNPNYRKT